MPHPRLPPTLLATCCIPWSEDGSFEQPTFRTLVRLLREKLTPELYIFGTAGEGYAVTDTQFVEICRSFWEEMQGVRPMVGVISLSLGTMIERIGHARDLGFRRFQLSLPGWGALNDTELSTFFREVCDRFPDCDFLHYNLARTKRLVTAAEYVGLARRHPNLVATKHGTDAPSVLDPLLRDADGLTHFITEKGFCHASRIRGCGLLVSISSMNFGVARRLFAAGQAVDTAALARYATEATQVIDILFHHLAGAAHMDGAIDKIFCRMHDPSFPLRLLPPYASLDEPAFDRIRSEIATALPNWVP